MHFEFIWENIIRLAGEEFYTKTKLPFRYRVVGDTVIPDRTGFPLDKSNFRKAAEVKNLTGPGKLPDSVMGPSYVYAIMTDKRIR